jgi:hypothetical protein
LQLLKRRPRDVQIGIIAFAGEADLVQTPTVNREDALAHNVEARKCRKR